MFHARRAPFRISSKDQLRVGNRLTNVAPRKIKCRQQILPRPSSLASAVIQYRPSKPAGWRSANDSRVVRSSVWPRPIGAPSSSRGHPDHGRRENPRATVTTSAQSERRPGEKSDNSTHSVTLPSMNHALNSRRLMSLSYWRTESSATPTSLLISHQGHTLRVCSHGRVYVRDDMDGAAHRGSCSDTPQYLVSNLLPWEKEELRRR